MGRSGMALLHLKNEIKADKTMGISHLSPSQKQAVAEVRKSCWMSSLLTL